MSIEQKNDQDIESNITQMSLARCVVTKKAEQNINATIVNSNVSNLELSNTVAGNQSSCALRSSLQSTVINSLKDKQGATQVDVPGPFTVMGDLVGSKDNITQENSQRIASQASQLINSLCQDPLLANQDVNLRIIGANVNGLKIPNALLGNKSSCVIQNTSSYFNQNSESNTQSATQVKIDSMIFMILFIVIGCVAYAAIRYGINRKGKKSSDSKDNTDNTENTILKSIINKNKTPKKVNVYPPPSYKQSLKG